MDRDPVVVSWLQFAFPVSLRMIPPSSMNRLTGGSTANKLFSRGIGAEHDPRRARDFLAAIFNNRGGGRCSYDWRSYGICLSI
jgi:hypothetical protein